MTDIKEIVTHPASLIASGLGVVGLAVKPALVHAVLAALWSSAGTIFTATSIAAFSLVPNIPFLQPVKPVAVGVAIVSGAVYLVKLVDQIYNQFQKRI